jgi:hypothetical protein
MPQLKQSLHFELVQWLWKLFKKPRKPIVWPSFQQGATDLQIKQSTEQVVEE